MADELKATDLKQALRYFDPKKPLANEVELRLWFVPRPSPRQRLAALLEAHADGEDPQKILFVGHRGSGKTSELNKLALELRGIYRTINVDVLDLTGRTTPEYEDLMLAIGSQVTRACVERRLIGRPLAEPVKQGLQGVLDWWRQLVAGYGIRPENEAAELGVQLSTMLGQVKMGVKQSSQTREGLKFQINQQMPELIRRLDWVIEQAEAEGEKLLIVVEGLDKVDLQSAKNIFRDHAPTITAPKASMIYTFPLALRHSDEFNNVRLSFPTVEFLPNVTIHKRDRKSDRTGRKMLRGLVLARLEEELITPEALRLLVAMSGGIPVWMVRLAQSSALYAHTRGAEKIAKRDAQAAVRDLRRDTLVPLTREDHQVLRKRHEDCRFSNDAVEQRLLYNGSLIKYENDVLWCDAHPVLWSLLEKDDVDGGGDAGGG